MSSNNLSEMPFLIGTLKFCTSFILNTLPMCNTLTWPLVSHVLMMRQLRVRDEELRQGLCAPEAGEETQP